MKDFKEDEIDQNTDTSKLLDEFNDDIEDDDDDAGINVDKPFRDREV